MRFLIVFLEDFAREFLIISDDNINSLQFVYIDWCLSEKKCKKLKAAHSCGGASLSSEIIKDSFAQSLRKAMRKRVSTPPKLKKGRQKWAASLPPGLARTRPKAARAQHAIYPYFLHFSFEK